MTFNPSSGARLLKVWWLRQVYHRAEIIDAERIPRSGPVLLVSNHGRLDFDVFILVRLLLRETGRFARGMADRIWFRSKITSAVMRSFGADEGNREKALSLLAADEMILTYPGGVPEIMNSRFGNESIRWDNRTGFARVSIASSTPIVPIAGIGINNGFLFLTNGRLLGRFLYQKMLKMGNSGTEYRDPLTIGLIPFPLPFSIAVHFPLPCKVRYFVGDPIFPPPLDNDKDFESAVQRLSEEVAKAMRGLVSKSRRRIRHKNYNVTPSTSFE